MRGGFVEIELSEEAALSAVPAAVTITGQTPTWDLSDDHYTLRTDAPLAPSDYQLTIGTDPLDLAGLALIQTFTTSLTVANTDKLVSAAADPRITPSSATSNSFGFQGHTIDRETALVYVRNRYYAPELNRFATSDPLGFGDGPSLYSYAANSPVNYSDPLGLFLRTGNSELEVIKDAMRNVGYRQLASRLKLVAGQVRFDLPELRDWIQAARTSKTMSLLFEVIRDNYVDISLQFVTDLALEADAGGGTLPSTWIEYGHRNYEAKSRIDPEIVRNVKFRLGVRSGDLQKLGSNDIWRFGWWNARLDVIVIHELGHAYGGMAMGVTFFESAPDGLRNQSNESIRGRSRKRLSPRGWPG